MAFFILFAEGKAYGQFVDAAGAFFEFPYAIMELTGGLVLAILAKSVIVRILFGPLRFRLIGKILGIAVLEFMIMLGSLYLSCFFWPSVEWMKWLGFQGVLYYYLLVGYLFYIPFSVLSHYFIFKDTNSPGIKKPVILSLVYPVSFWVLMFVLYPLFYPPIRPLFWGVRHVAY
jgi:hypothetical protein